MGKKQVVVVKSASGCRVLVNPEPCDYTHLDHLINPDMRRVRGLSPEAWDIAGGCLIAHGCEPLPPVDSTSKIEREVSRLEGRVNAIPRLLRMAIGQIPVQVPYQLPVGRLILFASVISSIISVITRVCIK